jgi:hypothetical protein
MRDEVITTPNSLSVVRRMVVTSSVPSRPVPSRPHPEVSGREADEDADAEQDRHAAVEDAFDGSIDRSVPGQLGGGWRKDGVGCHGLLHLLVQTKYTVEKHRRRWLPGRRAK